METNEIMRIFYICLALAVFFFLLILLAIFLLGSKGKKQKPDDKTTEPYQPIENAEQPEPIPEQEADDAELRSDESIAEPSAQSEIDSPTEEVRFEIVKKTVVWHTDEFIE
ncbi:MAG: hypothetical protein VZQ45_01350 [Ruminococcus sp.]|nr:hypothetical protein [Ruminococcus sp.]